MQKSVNLISLVLLNLFYVYCNSSHVRCIWHNNKCVSHCPEGLVAVRPDCSQNYFIAQRTCEHPEKQFIGATCNFSRCDCPEPTVLDTDTGYCYDVDNCPTKHT